MAPAPSGEGPGATDPAPSPGPVGAAGTHPQRPSDRAATSATGHEARSGVGSRRFIGHRSHPTRAAAAFGHPLPVGLGRLLGEPLGILDPAETPIDQAELIERLERPAVD